MPKRTRKLPADIRLGPSPNDAHDVVYFKRHKKDDPEQHVPGREFLKKVCPSSVRAAMFATLTQVAAARPKRFSGGGYWEKMSGDMAGWYEVRKDGPSRRHYRLFCRLDYAAEGVDKPLLVVITGIDKPFQTKFAATDYERVRALGAEYFSRNPRSLDLQAPTRSRVALVLLFSGCHRLQSAVVPSSRRAP